jgi:hypothetical protein
VRAVQHVFRRGAVYWWRRRLLNKSGEGARAPIAFSLRTRDLSRARSIAAHLAVASDGILRQEGREMLSAAQARSMLEAVAAPPRTTSSIVWRSSDPMRAMTIISCPPEEGLQLPRTAAPVRRREARSTALRPLRRCIIRK